MRYLRAYQYITDKPNWFSNLLLTTLCALIPVIGTIVVMGYLYEVTDALRRRDERRGGYPDFDFGRFSSYLSRGVWPFLANLLIGVVISAVLVPVYIAGAVASASLNSPVPFLLTMAVAVLVMLAAPFVIVPPMLHAGLSQSFDPAGWLRFTREFLGRVGGEFVVAMLFLIGTSLLAVFVGLLACFVGVYLTGTAVHFAHQHLLTQLYELYLERGGTPVPAKESWSAA
jgi:Protein of unknown function (DUF4013)